MNAAQNKNATPTKIYCNICKKAFSSKNAFVQHEKSKKHLKEVKDAEARKAKEEETSNIKRWYFLYRIKVHTTSGWSNRRS